MILYHASIIFCEAFWALAKFRHPTHQICFHSSAALAGIKFVKAETLERE